jgi:hypothetical protein
VGQVAFQPRYFYADVDHFDEDREGQTQQDITHQAPAILPAYTKQLRSLHDLAEWLQRLTAKVKVATVPGWIPASSDTVESEGQQMQ